MCELVSAGPTTFTALSACHTRSAIRCAVAGGRLRRPFRGVYVGSDVAGADVVHEQAVLARAAQLSIGRDLPPAFHTAAAVLGFGVLTDGRTHLLGPELSDHSPQPGLWVHSTARPPALTVVSGLTVVTAERAAVDLARTHSGADGLAVLDAALRSGWVTRASLLAEVATHEGLRGVVGARAGVLAADARAESPQESRLRWIAVAAGLPVPSLQIPLITPDGVYRLDTGYRDVKVGIEYDGDGHADRSMLRSDRARHNALTGLRWTMLYFTDWDVYRTPQRTADRLARHLGPRRLPLPISTVPWNPS